MEDQVFETFAYGDEEISVLVRRRIDSDFSDYIAESKKLSYLMLELYELLRFVDYNGITEISDLIKVLDAGDQLEWLSLILDGGSQFMVLESYLASLSRKLEN